MKFKLVRYFPQRIEIEVLPSQLVHMFPIEIQPHPVFGQLKRVWKTNSNEYSVENFSEDEVQVLNSDKHIKLKDETMLKLLQQLDAFEIVLYYSDKQDLYEVTKI